MQVISIKIPQNPEINHLPLVVGLLNQLNKISHYGVQVYIIQGRSTEDTSRRLREQNTFRGDSFSAGIYSK
jgi:hypothetical protein